MSEGIEDLCIDLQLKPDEFKVLVLAWQLDAEQMCRFSRSEFLRGCRALKADSCRTIQTRLPELALALTSDPERFKELYRFTYKVSREPQAGAYLVQVTNLSSTYYTEHL